MKANKPAGAAIVGYFPAVISEAEFNLARAAQEERINYDKLGRKGGARQGKYVNLFKGLLTHARDGEGYSLHNKGSTANPELLLINTPANSGRRRYQTFPYPVFEEAILKLFKELDPRTLLPSDDQGPSLAEVLRAKLANHRQDLSNLKRELSKGFSPSLVEVLRKLESEEEAVANQLQDELARTAKPLARTWDELPSLIELIKNAEDVEAAKLKVGAALRSLIKTGILLIVRKGSWRFAAVQFFFAGDSRRSFLIAHQTAGFHSPEAGQRVSLILPDGCDLRNPKHVAILEKQLLAAPEMEAS